MQLPTVGRLMEPDSRDTGHFHLAEGTLLPKATLAHLILATDQQWELLWELLVTRAALP